MLCPFWDGETRRMLDGMQQLMMSGDEYMDQDLFGLLNECFEELDADLVNVTEANWFGIRTYAQRRGNPGVDDWPACDDPMRGIWYEYNCTTQLYANVPIFESCYYSSNMAYYQTAIEICKRDKSLWSFKEKDS